jgi:uncharacterized membrane protein YdbT with pleckstrin-like domain
LELLRRHCNDYKHSVNHRYAYFQVVVVVVMVVVVMMIQWLCVTYKIEYAMQQQASR